MADSINIYLRLKSPNTTQQEFLFLNIYLVINQLIDIHNKNILTST